MAVVMTLKPAPASGARDHHGPGESRSGLIDFPQPAADCPALAETDAGGELSNPDQAEKAARKLEKRLETRVLDPWERYRALVDLVDSYTDLSEAADRKTRFGLLIV